MAMTNEQYWSTEIAKIEESIFKDSTLLNKEIDRLYAKHAKEIEQVINDFLVRFATANNNLDYRRLTTELLTPIDMIEYRAKINALTEIWNETGDENIMQLMDVLRGRQKVTIWQSLIDELQARTGTLAIEETALIEPHLINVYETGFAQTAYSLAVANDLVQIFTMPNEKALAQVIKYPLSGRSFSESIWKNADALLVDLKEELIRGAIQGTSVTNMAKNLKKHLIDSTGKYADSNTKRIVLTESAFVLETATNETYKEADVKKSQIIVSLDERTCKKCGHRDGDLVDVDKAVSGVNIPPFHPRCRCTTVPYIEDYEGTRIDTSDSERAKKTAIKKETARLEKQRDAKLANATTKAEEDKIKKEFREKKAKAIERINNSEKYNFDDGIIFGTNSLGNKVKAGHRRVPSQMKYDEWRSIYLDRTMTYEEWLESVSK